MIQEQKILLGSMDKNNSPESLNIYDYLDAHNIRTVGNGESEANYVTNLEGTELITVNLPQGQNRCIGSKGFEQISKAYFIRYNSMGYHQIIEFDFDSRTEVTVFENLTDSGNEDILGWTADTYFTDIRVVHDNFLILNNREDPIYCLNINSFKENRGEWVIKPEDLYLINQPNHIPVTLEYRNDPYQAINNLKGKLFQFRTQFEYNDYRTSAWSTVSKRPVPETEPAEGVGQNVNVNNCLYVWVNIGNDRVGDINIAVRENDGNWLLVKKINREYILNLPSAPLYTGDRVIDIPTPFVYENFNPSTNLYGFVFYNDGIYPVLDQVEVELNYDHIPKKAEAVGLVNGNMLAVGGFTEGYERPTLNTAIFRPGYYKPEIHSDISENPDPFKLSSTDIGSNPARVDYFFQGTPRVGDRVIMRTTDNDDVVPKINDYVVTSADASGGMSVVLNQAVNYMNSQGMPEGYYLQYRETFTNVPYIRRLGDLPPGVNKRTSYIYVQLANIGTLSTTSINTLKSGASYQLAYAPYDRFGRYFPIVTDDRFIVRFDPIARTQGLLPSIEWTISEEAPEEAVGYQILLSENQTFQNSVTLTGTLDTGLSEGGYMVFDLKSLNRINRFEEGSQISYDYTEGDVVTLIKTVDGDGEDVTWFTSPLLNLNVVGFEIDINTQDPLETKYLLKVRTSPLVTVADIEGVDIVMEIYTPKNKSVDSESEVFYEVGLNYPIVDGVNTVTSGQITEGDYYYRARLFRSNISESGIYVELEDPNFSDDYYSKYWSAGRARLYNDEEGVTEKKAFIRYSDEYILGSRYNGLGRFYSERIYGERGGETTSKHGWIRKLESRDNALMCFQEFKVGAIPVYKSIIYDNTDTSLVADSGRIFGSIQYRVGNYGIGTATESFSETTDGVMYFLDDNHCVPLRDSLSGLDVIDRNLSKYFIQYVKQAKESGSKFIGVYDNFYKEWNLTATDRAGELMTITLREDLVEYRDGLPQLMSVNVIQPENGVVTQDNWFLTYTPDPNYVGEDLIQIESGTNPIKNVSVNVLEGDDVPDDFDFMTWINQMFDTEVVSNTIVITGITMASPLTISGGEYSINGGVWTDVPTMVNEGDEIRVRHTTPSSYEAETITTLNVGGVVGTFVTFTVENGVDPNNYNNLRFNISEGMDSTARLYLNIDYGLKLEEESSLTSWVYYTYKQFGSTQGNYDILSLSDAQTSAVRALSRLYTDMVGGQIDLNLVRIDSSIHVRTGDILECSDGIFRVVNVHPEATFDTP